MHIHQLGLFLIHSKKITTDTENFTWMICSTEKCVLLHIMVC